MYTIKINHSKQKHHNGVVYGRHFHSTALALSPTSCDRSRSAISQQPALDFDIEQEGMEHQVWVEERATGDGGGLSLRATPPGGARVAMDLTRPRFCWEA